MSVKVNQLINEILLPVKLVIPQPIVAKIPGLTTNEDIRLSLVFEHLKGYCLDIGCQYNKLIRRYRETGGSGIGVDVFRWENADLVVENSAKLPFDDDSFDTISFVACLNHIPNRQEVLREAYRLLKSDGQILITNLNPVCSSIWHKVAYWDPDLTHRGMHKGEVFGFSDQEFRILMRKAGLKIIKKRYFNWGTNALYICRK